MNEVVLALENLETQLKSLKDRFGVVINLQKENDELTLNTITMLNERLDEYEKRLNNLEKKEVK